LEIRRRCQQKKHNLIRERALESGVSHHAGTEPTPSEVAMAREKWFRLLDNQPSHYKEVVQLRYLGYSSPEIAEQVGVDEGTVRRILRKILSHSKHEQEI
jgi:DNA-directed RNA polymerase specialized sigma24 family protein